jgi:hypothetical protein
LQSQIKDLPVALIVERLLQEKRFKPFTLFSRTSFGMQRLLG